RGLKVFYGRRKFESSSVFSALLCLMEIFIKRSSSTFSSSFLSLFVNFRVRRLFIFIWSV
ncbi:hypothetical protein CSUI_010814, partial [Cystoisospora suis]